MAGRERQCKGSACWVIELREGWQVRKLAVMMAGLVTCLEKSSSIYYLRALMSVAVAGSDGGRARLKSADQTPSYYRTRAPPRSDPLILPHLRGKVDKS